MTDNAMPGYDETEDRDAPIEGDDAPTPKRLVGKARWDLLPFFALEEVVGVLTLGAATHGDRGWLNADDAAEAYFAALMRHVAAWRRGERADPDTGLPTLAHIASNALILRDLEAADDPVPFVLADAAPRAVGALTHGGLVVTQPGVAPIKIEGNTITGTPLTGAARERAARAWLEAQGFEVVLDGAQVNANRGVELLTGSSCAMIAAGSGWTP